MPYFTRQDPNTSLSARLVCALTHAGQPLHYLVLARHLGHRNPQHVAVLCRNMARAGVLTRYARGCYGLPLYETEETP
jgi:hypothetical protein